MFYTVLDKNTFNRVMTMFFQNLGMVAPEAELDVKLLDFDGDVVVIEADVQQETLQ